MSRIVVLLGLLGPACVTKEASPGETDTGEPVTYSYTKYGAAPWDPLVLTDDDGVVAEPIVRDASGETVAMHTLEVHSGAYAWAPDADLPVGDYSLVGVVGGPGGWDESWTVSAYGEGSAFSADAVLGKVYHLDDTSPWGANPSLIGLGLSELGSGAELYLEVLDAADGRATFRVAAVMASDGTTCQVFKGAGELSEAGQLTWSVDELDVALTDGTVHTAADALRLGWLEDGSAAGGVELYATVDTRVVSTALFPDEVVTFLCYAFDMGCYDCTGDGVESCADVRVHAGTLSPAELTLDDELPLCGVDLEAAPDLPTFSCDFPDIEIDIDPDVGCGCRGARSREGALLLGLGLLGALRARRRSRARDEA